ncbi:MAG: hypothetical protein ACAI44_01800 [Candidatus Sericytochromatia bacterium]
MFKLILAAALLLSGSVLLIFAVRRFESIKVNLALSLTALLFLGQGTLLIGQVRSRIVSQQPVATAPAPDASASASASALAWDQGGTLQAATLDQWRLGDYTNRLASAADLLKTLRREQVFTASIRSEQEFQPWAAALVACLEASQAAYESPVLQLARQCSTDDGLRKYL